MAHTGLVIAKFDRPTLVTSLPLMLKTDTVPSARFATRARSPVRVMDRPAGPLPVSTWAMTFGGEAWVNH